LVLLRRPFRTHFTVARVLAFGLGLLPMAGYFIGNWLMTGSLLSTSAQAKSLASGFAWNIHIFDNLTRVDRVVFVYLSFAGALLICSPWAPWRGPRRQLAMLILLFPVGYYALLALRSSWQIWSWYMYPLPLAAAITLAAAAEVTCQRSAGRRNPFLKLQRYALPAALAVAIAMVAKSALSAGNNEGTLRAASALAGFSDSHPGRYAMGDRAGLTAFLVPRSFLQLEGLVADRSLLDDIREQRRLRDTLSDYNVDYLVEAVPTTNLGSGPCQEFTEPKRTQSGDHSPKMRDVFCDPLFRYDDPTDAHTTLVYAVLRESAGRP
jgi:hypothetical protein